MGGRLPERYAAAQMYTGCMAVLRQEARPDAGLKKSRRIQELSIYYEGNIGKRYVPGTGKAKARSDGISFFPGLFKELMFVIGGETCATVRKWRRNLMNYFGMCLMNKHIN